MGSSKLQNPKKAAMKHFMSPTISAATKAAAVPRMKILAERNDAFTFPNPQSQKPPILDSKTSPIISGTGRSVRSSYNSAYETDDDDDEEHNTFDADSSLKKPYDPLTNYLSPRPKFLRYNPNRRHKIFLRGENEATERKDGFGGIKTSVSIDSQKAVVEETPSEEEGSVKGDDERMDNSEGNHNDDEEEMEEVEEIEEFEEETCWSLTGVLKILLVLGALFLSTSYICSMNSPNPSPIQEAIWDFRDGFQKIQSNVYEVVTSNKIFDRGNQVIGGRGVETLMGLLAMNQRDMDDGFMEDEIVEEDDVDTGLVESTVGLGELVDVQNEERENVFNDGLVRKLKVPDPMPVSKTAASEVVCDGEVVGEVEGSSSLLWGSDFTANEGVSDQEMDKIREGSDQLQGFETAEKSESFQDTPIDLENEAASIDLRFKDEQMESEEQIKSQKATVGEGAGKEVVENEMEIVEDLMEVLVKGAMLEVVPLVIFFTIVTALGFVYRSRQKKSDMKEDYLPTETPLGEAVAAAAAEKISPVVCNVEKEKKLEKVESFASSSSIRSTKEASEEFSRHSQAPIVELLGELVIGEASSSLRRRKMVNFEENNRNSVSTEMMISRSKAPSVQIQGQPSQMEVSNADSPSFGSFTAEKKKIVVKKEEVKGEEVSMVITTPVRRSSRIRNRAMSP